MFKNAIFACFLVLIVLPACSDSSPGESPDASNAADARGSSEPDASLDVDAGNIDAAVEDMDFLGQAERIGILDAINQDCVFQSCDGDFNWDAVEVVCSTQASTCSVTFWTIPHSFVGSFDETKTQAAIGTMYAGNDGNGAYTGSYQSQFDDEDGRVLESFCVLEGYQSAGQVLNGVDLQQSFESHLLDCVFAIEGPMFDLLAD